VKRFVEHDKFVVKESRPNGARIKRASDRYCGDGLAAFSHRDNVKRDLKNWAESKKKNKKKLPRKHERKETFCGA